MTNLKTFLLPNQLFDPKQLPKSNLFVVEHPNFFSEYKYHAMKIQYLALAMSEYCKKFKAKLITHSDFKKLVSSKSPIYLIDPADMKLRKEFKSYYNKNSEIEILESPQFIFKGDEISKMLGTQKKYSMASFYIKSRRKLNLLLSGDKPQGGKWSFDTENREPIKDTKKVPSLPKVTVSSEQKRLCEKYLKKYSFRGEKTPVLFPFSHTNKMKWLNDFLSKRFSLYGKYQDAIHTESDFLYHSLLSPLLNSGILTPSEVVSETMTYAKKHKIPLNSVEGFIRQITGWREFIKGMYDKNPPEFKKNFFSHNRKMPASFYDGTTGVDPVDDCIKKVNKYGYLHHIERLMVVGNFMLLCEIKPNDVYTWYMELFVDAYHWVMAPNVFGMSQFSDGGLFTTKPYISSSKYIRKMSNYKGGEWEKIWDGLFWRFIDKHKAFFKKNPRLSQMTFVLGRMGAEKKKDHLKNAADFLQKIK